MSQQRKRERQAALHARRVRRHRFQIAGGLIVALALAGIGAFALMSSGGSGGAGDGHPPAAASDVTPFAGGARLVVDQPAIDVGAVAYNQPVEAVYWLRNDGNQPLILGKPTINVLEGC